MRRLVRPITYTIAAVAALAGFVGLRSATSTPLDWAHPVDWLHRAANLDAVVEIARWLGIGLATYVALVAVLVTFSEAALLVRAVPVARAINLVARAVAFPGLRRRLLDVSTAAAITAAAVNVAASAAPASAIPITLDVEAPNTAAHSAPLPATVDTTMFSGFGIGPAPAPSVPSTTPETGTVVIVDSGDTLWDLATAHYGFCDRALVAIIQDANPTMADARLIHRGQHIVLPALFPGDVAPPVVTDDSATWSVHVVRVGDTLWDILAARYGHVDADLVWRIADLNDLTDPSDIAIGTAITLPPLVSDEAPQSASPPATESNDENPTASIPPPTATVTVPASVPGPLEPEQHHEPAAPGATAPALTELSTSTTASGVPTTDTPASTSTSTSERRMAPLATRIGWQGPAALAAGLVALATLLRRERRSHRHRPPTDPVRDTDLALRTAPLTTNVEWAAETLRGVAAQLRPRSATPCPTPLCIQLDDNGLEVLWDQPRPQLADGWTTPNDGRSWHRTRDLEPNPSTAAAPCPALVTVGRHGPTEILLNLELGGVIALTGHRDHTLDFARSLCFELGTTPFKDVTNSLLCAFPLEGTEHLEWVRAVNVDEAVGWLTDRRDSARAHLAHRRLPSLFALRASHSQHDPHSPVIVIIDADRSSPADIDRLVSVADTNAGATVVIIGEGPNGAWKIDSQPDHVTISPLGLTLEPIGVSADMSNRIGTLLDEAAGDSLTTEDTDQPPTPIDLPEPVDADTNPTTTAEPDQPRPAPASPAGAETTPPEPAIVFRILGPISVDGLTERLRPIELELGVYLALHRHGQTADTIRTMIWPNGSADKTWRNVSSALRTKLGVDPDGRPRMTTRGDLGRYQLSPTITTDLDQFMTLLADSNTLDVEDLVDRARRAFEMIRGPLFADVANGYSWAFSDGSTSRIECEITRLSRLVLDRLSDAGRTLDCQWIYAQLEAGGFTTNLS